MQPETYMARISDKRGNPLYISPPYPTRVEAARDAFEARPNAKSCSTCVAIERNGEFTEAHKDIRSHVRI